MSWYLRGREPEEKLGFELLGAEVRRQRLALGWTQRMLEARSGIDQTVISRIENGKQYGIRWSRFAALVGSLGAFGVTPARPWPGLPNYQADAGLDPDDWDEEPDLLRPPD